MVCQMKKRRKYSAEMLIFAPNPELSQACGGPQVRVSSAVILKRRFPVKGISVRHTLDGEGRRRHLNAGNDHNIGEYAPLPAPTDEAELNPANAPRTFT